MLEPIILEERKIVKIDEMVLLWNPLEDDIEMKFDNHMYIIPSNCFLRVRERVASCLLQDYSRLGIVLVANTSERELEIKKAEGLLNLYHNLMGQLQDWVGWMGDQIKRGKGILGEPIRVKQLKILISELEDKLGLPRQMGSEVYEEIDADKERLAKIKGPKLKGVERSRDVKGADVKKELESLGKNTSKHLLR